MKGEVIASKDGTTIAARVFEPDSPDRGSVVIGGAMGVRAGSGYWRENAPQLKRSILYFWYVLVPVATRLFGYFPGRKLRKVGDDELMTLRGTHSLVDLYENAPRAVERLAPEDVGVRRLGHFGPFRGEHEQRLWPRLAQWLAGLERPHTA